MNEKFSRSTGAFIEKAETKKLTENYAKRFPHETKFAIFGKDIIAKLLNEFEGCEGIKIEFGVSDDGYVKPILTAVTADAVSISGSDVNASVICPPFCPTK